MTQRAREEEKKRLVALMEQSPVVKSFGCTWHEYFSALADDLLSNGVIVPPCKVGDVVYSSVYCIVDKDGQKHAFADNVPGFSYDDAGLLVNVWALGGFSYDEVGRTMFFTREEAEQAVKERNGK